MKEDRKRFVYAPYSQITTSIRSKNPNAPRRAKKARFVEDFVDLESQRLEELESQIAFLDVAEED